MKAKTTSFGFYLQKNVFGILIVSGQNGCFRISDFLGGLISDVLNVVHLK